VPPDCISMIVGKKLKKDISVHDLVKIEDLQ